MHKECQHPGCFGLRYLPNFCANASPATPCLVRFIPIWRKKAHLFQPSGKHHPFRPWIWSTHSHEDDARCLNRRLPPATLGSSNPRQTGHRAPGNDGQTVRYRGEAFAGAAPGPACPGPGRVLGQGPPDAAALRDGIGRVDRPSVPGAETLRAGAGPLRRGSGLGLPRTLRAPTCPAAPGAAGPGSRPCDHGALAVRSLRPGGPCRVGVLQRTPSAGRGRLHAPYRKGAEGKAERAQPPSRFSAFAPYPTPSGSGAAARAAPPGPLSPCGRPRSLAWPICGEQSPPPPAGSGPTPSVRLIAVGGEPGRQRPGSPLSNAWVREVAGWLPASNSIARSSCTSGMSAPRRALA